MVAAADFSNISANTTGGTLFVMGQPMPAPMGKALYMQVARDVLISFVASVALVSLAGGLTIGALMTGTTLGVVAALASIIHSVSAPILKKIIKKDNWPWWVEVLRRVVILALAVTIGMTFLPLSFTMIPIIVSTLSFFILLTVGKIVSNRLDQKHSLLVHPNNPAIYLIL